MKTKLFMLMAGIVLFASCSNSHSRSAYESADSAANPKQDSVKLIKTADARIKVKNIQKAEQSLDSITTTLGGMIMHNEVQSQAFDTKTVELNHDSVMKLTVYNCSADLVVRVPVQNLEYFMSTVNRLGIYTEASKMHIEDRSLDFLSEKLKAQNREIAVKEAAVREKKTSGTSKNDSPVKTELDLRDQLVDKKIHNLATNDSVKYSTVTLNLYQNNTVNKEIVANDDLSAYGGSLGAQVGLALARGWSYFSIVIIALMHLWAFILTGILVWVSIIIYNRYKKRKAAQLSMKN